MIEEYTLESRDGKTVLRVVHSGIPNTPDWDGFYDGAMPLLYWFPLPGPLIGMSRDMKQW